MENINKVVRDRSQRLTDSERRFEDIYNIMFSEPDLVHTEYTDGYRIKDKTYGEYAKEIPLAAAVMQKEFEKGGYIALAMENGKDWPTMFWSLLMSGHNVLLVNMRLPHDMICRALKTVGAVGVVSENTADYGIKTVTVDEVCSKMTKEACESGEWGSQIALFTSGTTLHEKVCVYTGRQIAEQVLNSRAILSVNSQIKRRYKGKMKQLAFLPFYHIYGLTAVYMWFGFFGRTFVFLRDMSGDTITKTVRKHNVTHIFAVPLLWHTIEKEILSTVASKDEKTREKFKKGTQLCEKLQNIFPRLGQTIAKRLLSEVTDEVFGRSIRFCITGGSYIRPSSLKLINSLGYPLYNGYGMTEIGITSVELGKTPKLRNEGKIGAPFGSVEYDISDEGELLVKGSSIFEGLYIDGEYKPFEDEWFHTGDFAEVDSKGRYRLLGRMSDCVIGEDGENLNPDEAERMINVPYAKRSCILGLNIDGSDRLSLVIEPEVAMTAAHCKKMMYSLYEQLAKLPPAYRINKIFFAQGSISSDLDIKVSRAGLRRRVENGSVKLINASEYVGHFDNMTEEEQNDEITKMVCGVIADVLKKSEDEVGAKSHFVFDLGGNSMQYITLVSELENKFAVHIGVGEDDYCATAAEFAKKISSLISAEDEA